MLWEPLFWAGVRGDTILGKEQRVCLQTAQVEVLLCWVTVGNLLYCSDPHIPHLKNGEVDTTNSLQGLGTD